MVAKAKLMALSNTHIIPELKKLLKELEDHANEFGSDTRITWNDGYRWGIKCCIEKIKGILDTA